MSAPLRAAATAAPSPPGPPPITITSACIVTKIFPTICDAAGIQKSSRLQGKSVISLINDEVNDIHDEIFSEVNFHAAYEPLRCVRTKRYKYLRRWLKRDKAVMPNCDDGTSKSLWMNNGWLDNHLVQEELYDLMFDPNETNNLIDSPELANTTNDLRKRLEKWMSETNDPALEGMPGTHCMAKAVANDQDALTPGNEGALSLSPEFCKRNEIL